MHARTCAHTHTNMHTHTHTHRHTHTHTYIDRARERQREREKEREIRNGNQSNELHSALAKPSVTRRQGPKKSERERENKKRDEPQRVQVPQIAVRKQTQHLKHVFEGARDGKEQDRARPRKRDRERERLDNRLNAGPKYPLKGRWPASQGLF